LSLLIFIIHIKLDQIFEVNSKALVDRNAFRLPRCLIVRIFIFNVLVSCLIIISIKFLLSVWRRVKLPLYRLWLNRWSLIELLLLLLLLLRWLLEPRVVPLLVLVCKLLRLLWWKLLLSNRLTIFKLDGISFFNKIIIQSEFTFEHPTCVRKFLQMSRLIILLLNDFFNILNWVLPCHCKFKFLWHV